MFTHNFTPSGVCSRNISVTLDDSGQTIESVEFTGGCQGNLTAIGKLVKGKPVEEVVALLQGGTCGKKPTSCTDQMTIALREAQELIGK